MNSSRIGLPLKKGRCGTMTRHYKRYGTTTLFAALEVATGKVIGQCMSRHRHQEWLKFLRRIDRETPKHLAVHLIADNYAFFGLITEDRIRRGVFKSVAELQAAIEQYLETHNADPRPFVWTASAITILEKVSRGRQTLESVH